MARKKAPEVQVNKHVYMFVYGTLRPGDYNHARFPGGVVKIIRGVKVRGTLYDGGLPFLDAFGPDDVVGDILVYDANSVAYRQVSDMEIGARYVPVMVEARRPVKHDPDASIAYQCIAWHYPHAADRGHKVKSGDWQDRLPCCRACGTPHSMDDDCPDDEED